ncbi:MAG: TolC family protein [Desulfobacterales bacterium]|nr:TolC family protein [Desulfobacterales bacterium]
MKKIMFITIALLGIGSMGYSQTLDDYFKIAAENNPGLQAKYKTFKAFLEKVPQVGSLPDPNLSFGYFISPIETRVGPQRARFSLTQMFPWFGTLKSRKNAAAFMAEAKYQDFLDARNKLFYQVSAAYYALFELNRWIKIEKENIQILESYKTIAAKNFENGKGAMVDVLRVDIMLKDAVTNLNILKTKKKPLETRFNKLLNRAENDSITVLDTLELMALPDDYRKDSLLASNPLIDELELKIKASETDEQIAVKQRFPTIGVGLDYVIVGKRSDMTLSDNGKDVFMPMVSVSLPIFGSKYTAAQKEARLMQETFKLQKEDLTNQLTSSYNMIWFEIQKQQDLVELYNQQILESEQSLNLLFTAYGNSGKDFEEVLRMQQQLLKYQKMKASAVVEFQTALAELDYITAKTK